MNTALRLLLIATLAVSGCFYLAGFDEIAPNQPATTSTGGGTSSTGGHGGNGDTGGTGGTGGAGGGGGGEVVTPWAKWFGVDGQNEKPQAVTISSAGDVFVAGYYVPDNGQALDIGGITLPGTAAGSALFVFKLNKNGSIEWAKNWDSDQSVDARSIVLDSSENIILALSFKGANPFASVPCGGAASGAGGAGGVGGASVGGGSAPGAALVRLDSANGDVLDCRAWVESETITITDLDYEKSQTRFAAVGYRETVSQGNDGILWLFDDATPSFDEPIRTWTFGDDGPSGNGGNGGGAACDGQTVGAGDQEVTSVAIEPVADGKIYVGGVFDGTVQVAGETGVGNCRDGWLARVYSDVSSSVDWVSTIGDDDSSQKVNSLALSPDGASLWVTGEVVGNATGFDNPRKPVGPGVDADVYLARYAALNGQPAVSKRFGDGNAQYGNALAVDSGGEVVVGGVIHGNVAIAEGNLLFGDGSGDFMLFKFDEAGSYQWGEVFNGDSYEMITDVAVDPNTRAVVLVGAAAGELTVGGDTFGVSGSIHSHIVVAKLTP